MARLLHRGVLAGQQWRGHLAVVRRYNCIVIHCVAMLDGMFWAVCHVQREREKGACLCFIVCCRFVGKGTGTVLRINGLVEPSVN